MGAQPSMRAQGTVPAGWLPLSHVEALAEVPGVSLVALSDVNEEALRKWGAHYGIGALHVDFRKLIDDMRPEILTVATRTPAKEAIIRYACEHGVRGLYVEKPLATSVGKTRELLDVIERADVRLAYGVNRRYHAVYREAKRLVQDGAIGDLVSIVAEHGHSRLLWTHPHTMDLLLYFAGTDDIRRIHATAADATVERRDESTVDSDPILELASIEFGNGVIATVSKAAGLSVRLAGTRGVLTIHANGSHLQLSRQREEGSPYFDRHEFLQPAAPVSATITALRELVAAVLGQGDTGIAPSSIASASILLFGSIWSHIQGRAIRPEELPSDFVVTGRSGSLYA